MIRINNIKITRDLKDIELIETVTKKYKIKKENILDWNISKKSIDARRKNDVHYVYSIDFKLQNEEDYKKFNKIKEFEMPKISMKNASTKRPIIIGAGPSGLFAGLIFVQNGICPIIIEQGDLVEKRKQVVDEFFKTGKLNELSNVQFGEGGAGTFSDGKLTTGINSPFCQKVLEEFVKFGAPKEILYLSKPHIGTDILIDVIKNIREFIISKGGKFLFNTKVIDFKIENNMIKGVYCLENKNTNENKFFIESDNVILAIGHSSRDTFKKLYELNINMEKKNFSVGLRIEHLQEEINKAQYGSITKLKLPAADYKLAYHSPSGRSCYTFCMCPGRCCSCVF